jgi:hypothetical protein
MLLLIGLLPSLWPAGLYLLASAPVFLLLAIGKLSADIVGWENSNYIRRVFAFTTLKGLRDTSASVIAGLLIICSVQLLLKTILWLINEESVKSVELLVIRQQKFLNDHMKLTWSIIAIIVLLLLQAIFPYIKAAYFKKVRTWASRVLTVLTVIASFSFFTQQTAASLERDWIAQRRPELNESLGRVKRARQALVINAYLQAQVEAIPAEKKQPLRSYFFDAANNTNREQSIHWLIEQLNNRPPDFSNATHDNPDFPSEGGGTSKPPGNGGPAETLDGGTLVENAINRVDKWVNAVESERVAPPSIEDAQILEAEANTMESFSYASTTIVEQTVKNVIDAHIPTSLDPLVKLFVKTLQDAFIKSMLKVLPARLRSFQEAQSWVQKNVFAPNFQTNWNWSVPTYARYQKATEPPEVYIFDIRNC